MTITIQADDLQGPAIAALLTYHLAQMHAHSPACSVHAMPIDRLRADDVTFYSAWEGERLAGCGAIKHLDAGHGELKSMRVDPAFLRKGVGRALLNHLIEVARQRGYDRVSLETGTSAPFIPAQTLYRAHGFAECPPFGDYEDDPFSLYMTLALEPANAA